MVSSSFVVTPGRIYGLMMRRTSATILQLSRISSISRGDLIVALAISSQAVFQGRVTHDRSELPAALDLPALHESVVVPHEQVRLDLLERIEADTDNDQQAGAAEKAC